MAVLPFGSGSYTLRSKPLSSQRMVNVYLEAAPPDAKTLAANVPSYGVKDFATAGNGPIRGGLVVNDRLFVVSGTALYLVNSNGVATSLGSIPNADRVVMAGDGTNVFIVTGGQGFLYNGTSVAQITDPDFPGAITVWFLDGYLIIIEPSSGRFYVAGPYDPANWNALDFATAESAPDNLVGMVIDHREIFFFGIESTEIWYNSGDADFPLTRTQSGTLEVGLLSKEACGKIANSVLFVANDYTVRMMDGYNPIIISTTAISQAIEDYEDKTCHCLTFYESGHAMAAFIFAAGCWVYDLSTKLWHERQSYGLDTWRPAFTLRAHGKLYVGDSRSNRIGVSDPETFTEWDQPLVASGTAPAISDQNRLIRHGKLELIFEQGVGHITGETDPLVMLQWSDDGGRTWSNELHRELGKVGAYKTRTIFNRLGAARDRVYRYSISSATRRTLIQAVLDAA